MQRSNSKQVRMHPGPGYWSHDKLQSKRLQGCCSWKRKLNRIGSSRARQGGPGGGRACVRRENDIGIRHRRRQCGFLAVADLPAKAAKQAAAAKATQCAQPHAVPRDERDVGSPWEASKSLRMVCDEPVGASRDLSTRSPDVVVHGDRACGCGAHATCGRREIGCVRRPPIN
jgi:hypothetical protein